MIQDRKRNVLRSLVAIFSRAERPDSVETEASSALESRKRLQERIELALEDKVKHPADHIEAA
jgi:hypothetical protein